MKQEVPVREEKKLDGEGIPCFVSIVTTSDGTTMLSQYHTPTTEENVGRRSQNEEAIARHLVGLKIRIAEKLRLKAEAAKHGQAVTT
jgi:hypothetical protein